MGAPDMVRVIVYDRTDTYVCDIDPTKLLGLTSTEEVNGEHSLTIKTTQELAKTDRLLVRDGMGIWHEYVVVGLVGEHGGRRVGAVAHEYYCVWSVQYDLSATYIDTQVGLVPGHPSVPAPARSGLEAALSGTNRWQIGTITVTNSGSASFYRRDGWEGLKTLTEQWGGEIDVTIEVSTGGVVGRYVNLLERVGTADVTRRFDYGSDLKDIKRKVSDDVWPCRIVPLGKATETEAGGYSRRPTIAAANEGIVWLEDSDAVPLTRIPDGQGGWEYPTSIIKNDVYSDPAQLKAWALDHIGQYTRPQVTYEAELVQLVKAGLNPHGVALGDDVIVVDHDFGGEGLAITARVIKIQQSLLDSTDTKLTVGNAPKTLSGTLGGMARGIERLDEQSTAAATYQATAAYLSTLLGRLNDEINLTGGYFYIVEGLGARCYDTQVSDPAVGTEASKVVEIRGGTIRIADTKTAQGEWNWRTVFVSGHVAADLVTAANLVAGYIGSANSGNYWDLDSGEFRLASTAQLGSKTVAQVVSGIDSTITGVDIQYAQGTSATVAPTTGWSSTPPAWEAGKYIWQRTATTTAAGTTYSTPVMISGKDGADGADGIGITAIVEQYYLSTSSTAVTGGSWSNTQQAYVSGKYYWTRSRITWSDTSVTTTTPVLAQGINNANAVATNTKADLDVLNTQQGVFNKLTNNGALQGLYMQNGLLYINGTYIQTGVISSPGGNIYWDLDTGDMNLEGDLTMVMDGTATNAHNYAKFGSMVWSGWVGGSRTPSGKTFYGIHLYSNGENRDGEMLLVPNADPSVTTTYAPSAILCMGKLYISANAGATDDNPHIMFGQPGNTDLTLISGESSGYAHRVTINDTNGFAVTVGNTMFRVKATNSTGTSGEVWARTALISSGFKSRLVDTNDYGQRLLYCYEAAKPMFGDVGSGTIGEDGLCYVEIDDLLSETMRTDLAYQVFLQKCGRGDLWVAERHPAYFVVEGTPGLEFSWEVKAVQTGFEHTRTESYDNLSWSDDEGMYGIGVEHALGDMSSYVNQIEALYETERL